MKIELSVLERIKLVHILPRTAGFADLIHIDEIGQKINISSDEASKLNLRDEKDEQGKPIIVWDTAQEKVLNLELSKEQADVIFKVFEDMLKNNSETDISVVKLFKKFKNLITFND